VIAFAQNVGFGEWIGLTAGTADGPLWVETRHSHQISTRANWLFGRRRNRGAKCDFCMRSVGWDTSR